MPFSYAYSKPLNTNLLNRTEMHEKNLTHAWSSFSCLQSMYHQALVRTSTTEWCHALYSAKTTICCNSLFRKMLIFSNTPSDKVFSAGFPSTWILSRALVAQCCNPSHGTLLYRWIDFMQGWVYTQAMKNHNPWVKLDPTMQPLYQGAEQTVGKCQPEEQLATRNVRLQVWIPLAGNFLGQLFTFHTSQ